MNCSLYCSNEIIGSIYDLYKKTLVPFKNYNTDSNEYYRKIRRDCYHLMVDLRFDLGVGPLTKETTDLLDSFRERKLHLEKRMGKS